DPHRARRDPARRGRPAAPQEIGEWAYPGVRDSPRLERALERDPRGEDGPDQQPDPDGAFPRNGLDGSVSGGARPQGTRQPGLGDRARLRSRSLPLYAVGPSEGDRLDAGVAAGRGDAPASGSRKVKSAPPPSRGPTSTVPPCSSAIRATM